MERRRAPRTARRPPAARLKATTATISATASGWAGRWRRALPFRVSSCPIAAARAGSPARICRRRPSSRSCRITIRSAIAPSASASAALAPSAAVRAITAVYLLLPQVPMLFMGEEWHAHTRFCSSAISAASLAMPWPAGVARSLRASRRFAMKQSAPASPTRRPRPPSTTASLTGQHWTAPGLPPPCSWYRELLAVRRRHIVPLLSALRWQGSIASSMPAAVLVSWQASGQQRVDAHGESQGSSRQRSARCDRHAAVAGGPRRRSRKSGAVERALEPARLKRHHDPARHLSSAAAQRLRFRSHGRVCPVPGRARRQSCLCLALSEGASRQRPRLRHRRSRASSIPSSATRPHSGA